MNATLIALALLLQSPSPTPSPTPAQDKPKPKVVITINDGAATTDLPSVTLKIEIQEAGPGLVEMALSHDGTTWMAWRPFGALTKVDLPPGDGPKTIFVKVLDQAGQESEPASATIVLARPPLPPRTWTSNPALRIGGGAWLNGISFDALTLQGTRALDPGTMALARVELSFPVREALSLTFGGDYAQGEDSSVVSFGFDFEFTFASGDLIFGEGSLGVYAGAFGSKLEVDIEDFGDFDAGTGFRGGLAARFDLGAAFSADLAVEYRHASWSRDGGVISGDDSATADGAVLSAGLGLRF